MVRKENDSLLAFSFFSSFARPLHQIFSLKQQENLYSLSLSNEKLKFSWRFSQAI